MRVDDGSEVERNGGRVVDGLVREPRRIDHGRRDDAEQAPEPRFADAAPALVVVPVAAGGGSNADAGADDREPDMQAEASERRTRAAVSEMNDGRSEEIADGSETDERRSTRRHPR